MEETTNYRQGTSASPGVPYVTLQTPTAAEQALLDTYDPGSDGNSIPFIVIGNRYVEISNLAPYGPQGPVRQELEPDRRRAARPVDYDRARCGRLGQLPDRRNLHAHRQSAGHRVHPGAAGAGTAALMP